MVLGCRVSQRGEVLQPVLNVDPMLLVAQKALGLSNCCQNGSAAGCNQTFQLDKALSVTSNLAACSTTPTTPSQVLKQIAADRPVAARIGWRGSVPPSGHFVVIMGVIIGKPSMFLIDDPCGERSEVDRFTFCSNYQGSGSWTHTYLTK